MATTGDFQFVPVGTFTLRAALQEGQCTIDKAGSALFLAGDLALAKIGERAAVLVDRATSRIALRAPQRDELDKAARVHVVRKKGRRGAAARVTDRRKISLAKAIRTLDFDVAKMSGLRFELRVQGELLLLDISAPIATGGVAGERKGAKVGGGG